MINALNVGIRGNLPQSYFPRGGKHYPLHISVCGASFKGALCSTQQLVEVDVVTLTSGGCSLRVQGKHEGKSGWVW